jgi:predicted AlkP superfamily pyrophosphatase or phosphodiesterase
MKIRRMMRLAAVIVSVALIGATVRGKDPERPKLVVVLVVDQMRADYVDRFGTTWHGGLRRLIDQGAWFTNAAYPYANTVTCAGHATISTGDYPATHGMIDNEWWDRSTQKEVTCTSDPQTPLISYGADSTPGKSGDSAWRLESPSFAEQLRSESRGSRVVTLSLKARAAISLAGHHADVVTWLDGSHWATSTSYGPARAPAIESFIEAHPIEADFGKTWTDSPVRAGASWGKREASGLSSEFPHALGLPAAEPTPAFYGAWAGSPFSDAYLGQMAESAIDSLKLGREPGIDFLGISFSALDIVGHQYGPQSVEIRNVLANLDQTLGALFEHLDRSVGRENYVVAFSADHGVAPIPEAAAKNGTDAGRADSSALVGAVEDALARRGFGKHPVAAFNDSDLYFAAGVYDKLKANPKAIERAMTAARNIRGTAEVFRADELARAAEMNPIAHAASLSYFPGRSGDLIVITKPFWFFDEKTKNGRWSEGTTHGSPYPYDQRVPILLMGAAVRPARYTNTVTPADIAPTLAELCGVRIAPTDGHPLHIR